MAQLGQVEEVENDHIFVKVIREGACAHCRMCTSGVNEGKECIIEAVNKCGAEVGDTVEIDVQANFFLRATAIMYGIPLIAMIVGISISLIITKGLEMEYADAISAFVGVTFTALAYLGINKRERNNKNIKYIPIAISKETAEVDDI